MSLPWLLLPMLAEPFPQARAGHRNSLMQHRYQIVPTPGHDRVLEFAIQMQGFKKACEG